MDSMLQTLDGCWTLVPDPGNVGREERWFEAAREGAQPARVPGVIHEVFPDYHGVAWYWHTFRPARAASANERVLLRFGAVDYLAAVWLNGQHVGGHEGGETPFELDITDVVKPGSDNLLAVRVLNPTEEPIDGIRLQDTPHSFKCIADYMPGRAFDFGGIMMPVEAAIVPAVRIADLYARPDVASGEIHVSLSVRNDSGAAVKGRLEVAAGPAETGEALDTACAHADLPPGETTHELTLTIARPHLWDLDEPYLYFVRAALKADAKEGDGFAHERSVRCGFRDFRVVNGYFRLNGRRVFLRSAHTMNCVPIGQLVPPTPDMLRRDLVFAKASGFNTVRFISKVAYPYQLDLCDEMGLMVYEENYASWCLQDSPRMAELFDNSFREMILRDRNHPSITIWGMLNEMPDGPVFRHAVEALRLVRDLDETRVVLLSSGRWDSQLGIGSLSNPGSREWEHQWGAEEPGTTALAPGLYESCPGFHPFMGDVHAYPVVPHQPDIYTLLRTLGDGAKPVYLSEYGIGSLLDAIGGLRKYEESGARPDLQDAALFRQITDKLEADWRRFGLEGVYPFPEDMLRESQRLHSRQRRLGFDLVRSNPNLCGFNLTSVVDGGITGEGVWTFWREWKPGVADALRDGWAPLRWCLFVAPWHGYTGRSVKLEAVLANEDVLAPGEYPVHFRVTGPQGVAWERRMMMRIPEPAPGEDGPLAVPVLCEEASVDGPPGAYDFAARMERGGAPAGDRVGFYLSDAADLPRGKGTVVVWGLDERTTAWLRAHGVRCRPLSKRPPRAREVILVGVPKKAGLPEWQELARRVARGCAVVFLNHEALKRGDDNTYWLPLARKGRCNEFHDWLYHKECVAKAHPIFERLQSKGIMDWDYYDQVIPHHFFEGQDTPGDVAAVAFAVGYSCPGGYASGVLVGSYEFGVGRMVLNTLRVLENLDGHPAADRLLLNLVRYARQGTDKPLADLPADFDATLHAIGYGT